MGRRIGLCDMTAAWGAAPGRRRRRDLGHANNGMGEGVAVGQAQLSYRPESQNPLLGPQVEAGKAAIRRALGDRTKHQTNCPWVHEL